jgi:hypothetical protein
LVLLLLLLLGLLLLDARPRVLLLRHCLQLLHVLLLLLRRLQL